MDRAKLFKNGQGQAVRLPKSQRFQGTEVFVRRMGNGVLLLPVNDPWPPLHEALATFSDDFMEHREQLEHQRRERLD